MRTERKARKLTLEENARHIFREFGCIEKTQFLKLMPKGGQKQLKQMLRRRIAYMYGNYVTVAPDLRPDEKTCRALDILLCFYPRIHDNMYYSSSNVPFQIFFIMDGAPYFISVLRDNEDYFLRLPSVTELNADTTLLIGLPSKEMMNTLPKLPCKTVAVLLAGNKPEFYEKEGYALDDKTCN